MDGLEDECMDGCIDVWMLKLKIDFEDLKSFARNGSIANPSKGKVVTFMFLVFWGKN